MSKLKLVITSLVLALTLSACSGNIDRQEEEARVAVIDVLRAKEQVKANDETDDIKFYLPQGSSLKSIAGNNLIFEKASQIYILFYNPHEDENSPIVYSASKLDGIDYQLDETFTENEQFAFMLAHKVDDKLYELTVGLGGVKVTTETKVRHLKKNAKMMMEIASSVEYIK